jgi:ABC-2 type transport system permease protein
MHSFLSLVRLSGFMLRSLMRSPAALFFGFAFPLIFIALFGFLGSGDGKTEVAIYPDSIKSGPVWEALTKSAVISLKEDKSNETIADNLNKGDIGGAIRIAQPEGSNTYQIQLFTSAGAPRGAAVLGGVVQGIEDGINRSINPITTRLVASQVKVVEGRTYRQIDFILPGQLSFALLSSCVFTTAFSFIRLRKTLVLKRLYATPVSRGMILGAKLFATLIQCILQATLIILVGVFAFHFTLVNGLETFFEMLLLSALGCVVFLSFGLFVSSIADTEDTASPLSNIFTLPQFILSGSFFPVTAFPDLLQKIAHNLPMTFLNDAMRTIAFDGGGLQAVLPQIGGLLVWAVLTYLLTIRVFRWE